MSRKDGRNDLDLLPIHIERDVKPNYTNSIYIENNSLKLLCAIKGPYASAKNEPKMELNIKIKIPIYYQEQGNVSYNETKLEDIFVKHILTEKYPRTKLDIVIEVFEFNCDYFPFAVMAISMCANIANIEQRGILSCCSIIIKDGHIVADPSFDEEDGTKMIIGCNIFLKENFMFTQLGKVDDEIMKNALATGIKICESYHNLIITNL